MTPSPPARRAPTGGRGHARILVWVAVAAVFALSLGALMFGIVFPYTESPGFCPACHEMAPYHDAWTRGTHRRFSCLDCHVEQGLVNHTLHKFVALQEVVSHYTGGGTFPKLVMPEIPDARCLYCHDGSRAAVARDTLTGTRFSHAKHAKDVVCRDCHVLAGHAVTDSALASSGALNSAGAAAVNVVSGAGAAARQRPSGRNVAGHRAVVCSACHDMPRAGCAFCHTSPHKERGVGTDCARCHKPGARFDGAAHPNRSDCASCHTPPSGHPSSECARCHRPGRPFTRPTFVHPTGTGDHTWLSFPCKECHPKGFATADCRTCHARSGGGD